MTIRLLNFLVKEKQGDNATVKPMLAPFFEGLTGEQRQEVENQSNYIAQLAYKAAKSEVTRFFGAVGRNEPCPCGSGVKYKKCHGA